MAKRKYQPVYVKAQDPAAEANRLYAKYTELYGNSRLLDQAVRVVTHWCSPDQITNNIEDMRVIEIFDESQRVENASRLVAMETGDKSDRAKHDLIVAIRGHLLDCLGLR